MKMEQKECSEPSVYKIQKQGNYPEENIQQFFCNLISSDLYLSNFSVYDV